MNVIDNKKDVQEYKISEKYKVGQMIYHPIFKDNGIIIKKKEDEIGKIEENNRTF